MLSTLGNYGFANKTGAVSVPTTGGAKLVGAFWLSITNGGGLAIGNIPAEIKVTIEEPLGGDNAGVDMNDTRSFYVLLNREVAWPKEGCVELVIFKTTGTDEQNYAEFHDGLPITLEEHKSLLFVQKNCIIWVDGFGPSGPDDGQNFDIRAFQHKNKFENNHLIPVTDQIGTFPFRVYNTDAAFGNITFLPLGGNAPDTEHRDPYILIDPQPPANPDTVGPTSGFMAQQGWDKTFHWTPQVTIHNAPDNATAACYDVGIIQNFLASGIAAFYVGNNEKSWELPYLPILDIWLGNGPWYATAPIAYGHFVQINDTITLNMQDSPTMTRWPPVRLNGNPGDPVLQFVERNEEIRTWIVVRFIKQGDADCGATKRIYNVDWNLEYNIQVDLTQNPIAFPNPNKANRARIVAVGDGSPKMVSAGPTYNKSIKQKP
jgi:hypothetical protein